SAELSQSGTRSSGPWSTVVWRRESNRITPVTWYLSNLHVAQSRCFPARSYQSSGATHLVAISGKPWERNSKFNASTCKSVTGLSSSAAKCLSCLQVSGETLLRMPLYGLFASAFTLRMASTGCCATVTAPFGFLAAISLNEGRLIIFKLPLLEAGDRKLLPRE